MGFLERSGGDGWLLFLRRKVEGKMGRLREGERRMCLLGSTSIIGHPQFKKKMGLMVERKMAADKNLGDITSG